MSASYEAYIRHLAREVDRFTLVNPAIVCSRDTIRSLLSLRAVLSACRLDRVPRDVYFTWTASPSCLSQCLFAGGCSRCQQHFPLGRFGTCTVVHLKSVVSNKSVFESIELIDDMIAVLKTIKNKS